MLLNKNWALTMHIPVSLLNYCCYCWLSTTWFIKIFVYWKNSRFVDLLACLLSHLTW